LQGKPISALNATDSVIGSKPTAMQVAPASQQTQKLDDIHAALVTVIQYLQSGTSSARQDAQSIVGAITNTSLRASALAKAGPRTTQPPRVSYPA